MQPYSFKDDCPRLVGQGAFSRFVLLFGFVLLILTCRAQSVSSGTVTGRVSNAQTGAYLEGATVEVVGSDARTLTERDGSFTLTRVPAGSRQLRVFYTGTEMKTVEAEVTTGSTTLNVALSPSDVHILDTLTVSGQRE